MKDDNIFLTQHTAEERLALLEFLSREKGGLAIHHERWNETLDQWVWAPVAGKGHTTQYVATWGNNFGYETCNSFEVLLDRIWLKVRDDLHT